jgi:hypothetical protein
MIKRMLHFAAVAFASLSLVAHAGPIFDSSHGPGVLLAVDKLASSATVVLINPSPDGVRALVQTELVRALVQTDLEPRVSIGSDAVMPPTAPEPATLALVGVGLAGLAAIRRRKLK